MNLSEVLTALLAAEDEAADSVEDARGRLRTSSENREKFAADQEARLTAARPRRRPSWSRPSFRRA